jgi:hypothetical protein
LSDPALGLQPNHFAAVLRLMAMKTVASEVAQLLSWHRFFCRNRQEKLVVCGSMRQFAAAACDSECLPESAKIAEKDLIILGVDSICFAVTLCCSALGSI